MGARPSVFVRALPLCARATGDPRHEFRRIAGSDRDRDELLKWLAARHLTEDDHLPLLIALGVKRLNGRVGALTPLRALSFTELSHEIEHAWEEDHDEKTKRLPPCHPYCAADKAALYEALREK